MPTFSTISAQRLVTCDPRLQAVMNEVVKHFDCAILCGHRNEQDQEQAFADGKSKSHFPMSKHNHLPAWAVDVAPYPIDWKDMARWRYFAGFVMGVAAAQGVKLRWGGDWDRDTDLSDNRFNDLPHFELAEP